MDYLAKLYIDGVIVTHKLLPHIKLFKIIRSDTLLVDQLYLIIETTNYHGPILKERSCLEIHHIGTKYNKHHIDTFYIYEDKEITNNKYLTEKEKAIANNPKYVIYNGLSASSAQIDNLKRTQELCTSYPVTYQLIFKNTNLSRLLNYMKEGLAQDTTDEKGKIVTSRAPVRLRTSSKKLADNIPNYEPQKLQQLENGIYKNNMLEELAEIFYSIANIRNNNLYFLKKHIKHKDYKQSLTLSDVLVTMNTKNLIGKSKEKKGIEYKYWEHTPEEPKKTMHLGHAPYLTIPNCYEKSLAKIYATYKIKKLEESDIMEFTLDDHYSLFPGYYLVIKKGKSKKFVNEKDIENIVGNYFITESIITGIVQEEQEYAGSFTKKAKLDQVGTQTLTWSTSLKLLPEKRNRT